jgi:4a-hydroxytetrahydrobiopterin dehydratase
VDEMTDPSEQAEGITPAEFHEAGGVGDWRVTSWGPQACFRASTLGEAARLVPVILEAAERFSIDPDVDLRSEAVVVRVHYRGRHRIPSGAAAFASAVSENAAALGLAPAPEWIQTVDISVMQHLDADSKAFWAAALGYDESGDTDAVDPLRRGPSLSFQPFAKEGRGRTHIDVSVPADRAEQRVAAALAAGGRLVDASRAPQWWTLASPDNHGIDIAAWTDTWG